MQLVIGTYTERLPHVNGTAEGILTARLDEATGAIGAVSTRGPRAEPVLPGLVARWEEPVTRSARPSRPAGKCPAYARDPGTGGLTLLNTVPSLGPAPCFVSLDRSGRFVLVANYGTKAGSVTVYETGPDGRLGDMTSHVEHSGSGPDPARQAGPHAHMAVSDPVTGTVLVTDLGADAVLAYRLDAAGGLTLDDAVRLPTVPGAGPRHLAFHPGGQHLFPAQRAQQHGRPAAPRERPVHGGRRRLDAAGRRGRPEPGRRHPGDPVRPARAGLQPGTRQHRGLPVRPGAVLRWYCEATQPPRARFRVTCWSRRADGTSSSPARDSDLLASYPFDDRAGVLGEPVCVAAPTPGLPRAQLAASCACRRRTSDATAGTSAGLVVSTVMSEPTPTGSANCGSSASGRCAAARWTGCLGLVR